MKGLKIPEQLIKDMDAALKQLRFYQANKKSHDIPPKLEARIKYLRGYALAIKELDKLDRAGKMPKNVAELQQLERSGGWYF